MRKLKSISLWICILCLAGLVAVRLLSAPKEITKVQVATWDALGYYMYLPGIFIYHDLKDLAWYHKIDSIYHPTGNFYQAGRYKNGNYVFKYLFGAAITYSPFFFVADYAAPKFGYPQDGFSFPYQLAICLASLFYSFLGLLVLRKVLLYYFSEKVTAITLLLVAFTTNYPQYAAVDCGMTHTFLFALYCFQLYVTIRWYSKPRYFWAFSGGLLIGIAAITRPTDGVMLLIPLLWNEPNREAMRSKWLFVKEHKSHVLIAGAGLFIGVLPQLIYWKYITGNWVYDVGSKWYFLNPWWRVLIGWGNGWLIYTPITVFFIIGLFLMKGKPFKKSVTVLFIINTWIIISWSDWTYGGTYSCRALVQSYPVLALAFACAVTWCLGGWWKYFFGILWSYLLAVNIFQLYQYNKTILHCNRMNRLYYQAIYLNPHPTVLDMSLLDTEERLCNEQQYHKTLLFSLKDTTLKFEPGKHLLQSIDLAPYTTDTTKDYWIKVDLDGVTSAGLWQSSLDAAFVTGDTTGNSTVDMANALNKENEQTKVSFYKHLKHPFFRSNFQLSVSNRYSNITRVREMNITLFVKDIR